MEMVDDNERRPAGISAGRSLSVVAGGRCQRQLPSARNKNVEEKQYHTRKGNQEKTSSTNNGMPKGTELKAEFSNNAKADQHPRKRFAAMFQAFAIDRVSAPNPIEIQP